MLLASAPWSLLGSQPMSRAHDRSLRQGDPTRRTKLTDHAPSIHCLTRSPTHPTSIQHPSTNRGSIYLPRIQSNGAKVWHVVFFNLQGIRVVRISWINNSPVGPGHCLVYLVIPTRVQCHTFQRRRKYLLQPTHNQSRLDTITIKQQLTSGPGALDVNRS